MATWKRRQKAQSYEQKHWLKVARRIRLNQDELAWYKRKADRLKSRFLSKVSHVDLEQANILEIRCPPVSEERLGLIMNVQNRRTSYDLLTGVGLR